MCREAEELEMQPERYIQDLQQALTGTEKSANYSFVLTPSPPNSSSAVTLAYEKVQRDISVSVPAVITPISAWCVRLNVFICSDCLPVRSAGNAGVRFLLTRAWLLLNQFRTKTQSLCWKNEEYCVEVWKSNVILYVSDAKRASAGVLCHLRLHCRPHLVIDGRNRLPTTMDCYDLTDLIGPITVYTFTVFHLNII